MKVLSFLIISRKSTLTLICLYFTPSHVSPLLSRGTLGDGLLDRRITSRE